MALQAPLIYVCQATRSGILGKGYLVRTLDKTYIMEKTDIKEEFYIVNNVDDLDDLLKQMTNKNTNYLIENLSEGITPSINLGYNVYFNTIGTTPYSDKPTEISHQELFFTEPNWIESIKGKIMMFNPRLKLFKSRLDTYNSDLAEDCGCSAK